MVPKVAIRALSSAVTMAVLLVGVSHAGADAAVKAPVKALQLAGEFDSGYSYKLFALPSCEVGDGLAVVVNSAAVPVRITSIAIRLPVKEHTSTSFEVMVFRPGMTSGEIAASFDLKALSNGHDIGAAIGTFLTPLQTGHLWYAIIARVHLLANASSEWEIRGIGITYEIRGKTESVFIPQEVRLPPTVGCG
jgi:hypothetical protein